MKIFGYSIIRVSDLQYEQNLHAAELKNIKAEMQEIINSCKKDLIDRDNRIAELETICSEHSKRNFQNIEAENALKTKNEKLKVVQQKVITDIDTNIDQLTLEVIKIQENIDDMTSSAEEISSSSSEISATANSINALANKVSSATSSTFDKTKTNIEMCTNLLKSFEVLKNSVSRIREMTELITKVSGQLNLLAMNAAIEAAHAGIHGKGFAVVAEEVRKLADSTFSKSKEIKDLTSAVTEGMQNTDKVLLLFSTNSSDVNTSTQDISQMIASVSQAITEQVLGIDEITKGLSVLTTGIISVKEKYELVVNSTSFMKRYLGTLKKYIEK